MTTRPGQGFTVFGAALALTGGFFAWYEATVVFGGHTIPLIDANGWQEPNAGLSILAIGLCATAGLVALAELLFRNARGPDNAASLVGLVPIGLGITALALVVAKYLAEEHYASVGFLVTGVGCAFVALGGVLSLCASVVTRSTLEATNA
jgi:hypothetical protein